VGRWLNHERSRKHVDRVAQLRAELEAEDAEAGQDDDASGANDDDEKEEEEEEEEDRMGPVRARTGGDKAALPHVGTQPYRTGDPDPDPVSADGTHTRYDDATVTAGTGRADEEEDEEGQEKGNADDDDEVAVLVARLSAGVRLDGGGRRKGTSTKKEDADEHDDGNGVRMGAAAKVCLVSRMGRQALSLMLVCMDVETDTTQGGGFSGCSRCSAVCGGQCRQGPWPQRRRGRREHRGNTKRPGS
jgi:hypothetical protein